ncbi:hypothetical protein JG687_00019061 [Phytophthora cactorum]|uniref:Uncharacterized protein n=1 Tax=Phytophthora cactorum TaxID=29920 RepID=A0A8T1TKD1_9STRA|nr:hypothetical protein JG687_00019061 [Phytophthora cactorum]
MYMLVGQNTNLQKYVLLGMKCGNQRMQDDQQAMLALQNIEGKGIALVADQVINRDELVAQYAGEVASLSQYVKREKEAHQQAERKLQRICVGEVGLM